MSGGPQLQGVPRALALDGRVGPPVWHFLGDYPFFPARDSFTGSLRLTRTTCFGFGRPGFALGFENIRKPVLRMTPCHPHSRAAAWCYGKAVWSGSKDNTVRAWSDD
eukprot:EG_transcript_43075